MTESMNDIRLDDDLCDDLRDESLDRVDPSRFTGCRRGEARICVVGYSCA